MSAIYATLLILTFRYIRIINFRFIFYGIIKKPWFTKILDKNMYRSIILYIL